MNAGNGAPSARSPMDGHRLLTCLEQDVQEVRVYERELRLALGRAREALRRALPHVERGGDEALRAEIRSLLR